MNFKYFIITIYLLFVSLILVMVFKSCGQNIDLETKEYYAEELKFQSRIDAKQNGNAYSDSFSIRVIKDSLHIQQPASLQADSIRLEFKKPDNAKSDRIFRINGSYIPAMPVSSFAKGVYGLKIRMFNSSGEFLIEKKIKL